MTASFNRLIALIFLIAPFLPGCAPPDNQAPVVQNGISITTINGIPVTPSRKITLTVSIPDQGISTIARSHIPSKPSLELPVAMNGWTVNLYTGLSWQSLDSLCRGTVTRHLNFKIW